jgi:hypothetical protein
VKRIFNLTARPFFLLPNGVTLTQGGPPSDVLNEDILDSPIVKQALEKGEIRIEDVPEPPKSRPA